MREQFESRSVAELRQIAKEKGIARISALRKSELIDAIVQTMQERQSKEPSASAAEQKQRQTPAPSNEPAQQADSAAADQPRQNRRVQRGTAAQTEQTRQGGRTQQKPQNEEGRTGRASQRTQRNESNPSRQSAQRDQGQHTRQGMQRNQAQQSRQGQQRDQAQQPRQTQQRDQSRQNQQREQGQQGRQNQQREQGQQSAQTAQTAQPVQTVQTVQTGAAPVQAQPAGTSRQSELAAIDSGNTATGILEIIPEGGYGFLRSENYLPGESDVYVAPSQIRKFNLKTGDVVTGNTRVKTQQEKYSALLYIQSINGFAPEAALRRHQFEDMTPIFPNERLRMERQSKDVAMRIVDLFSPVGKGQRGMIVSPPKAGKTTLLKEMATSILQNSPDMHIIIMLIDERPEEVTDIREAIVGDNVEVLYSTFDELPEHHKRVSEMGIERAKRLVEYGQDVVILLDSITRLARAYNLTVQPSGRTLSGGLDPAALHMPKRFFGAARNMREGGSLTILATALVDTGSKMDDVVYEEFKGTGNMELVLDRKLSERRVFPAIDIQKSGTRREDLLLEPYEQEAVYYMRRALNGMRSDEAVESILNLFVHTRSNEELAGRIRMQRRV